MTNCGRGCRKLAEWKLELGLEGGCVKPWGVTGKEASDFVIEKLTKCQAALAPGTASMQGKQGPAEMTVQTKVAGA